MTLEFSEQTRLAGPGCAAAATTAAAAAVTDAADAAPPAPSTQLACRLRVSGLYCLSIVCPSTKTQTKWAA